ncbi:MAG: hypothetical protein IPH00_16635 [Flavobacteriales bacterium]|nr:hypothetical protein [Flavobacteriales bacterium]
MGLDKNPLTPKEQHVASLVRLAEQLREKDMCDADRLLYERAKVLVQETVALYVSTSLPFVQGDQRDEWLVTRLRKIRERYLVPLRL